MAFSWAKNKKRIVKKLKVRILILSKNGNNAQANKERLRLQAMEKHHG